LLTGSGHDQAALILAQSILERVGRDIDLRDGEIEARTRDGFSWRLRMTPYDNAAPCTQEACDLVPQGIVVQVDVEWTEQRRIRQVHLSTLRLAERSGD